MAITYGFQGDLLSSVQTFEQMVPIARKTAELEPTLDSRRGLASSLVNLANAQLNLTRFAEATASNTESLGIYRALALERPGDARLLRRIYGGLLLQGQIEGAGDRPSLKRPSFAAARFAEAPTVLDALLAADPGDHSSHSDAGLVHDLIAYSLRDVTPTEAIAHAAHAARLLNASSENTEFRAQARVAAADAHRQLRQLAPAEALLRESSGILKVLGTDTEADLALAWARLGIARGDSVSASSHFDRAIRISEALFQKTPTPATAWALSRALEFAALALPASASTKRQQMVKVWTDQVGRYPGHAYIEERHAWRELLKNKVGPPENLWVA